MKILDRYVIITFLKNYLISFLVLIGLYVALDMVFNFDNLVEPPKNAVVESLPPWRIVTDIFAFYMYQVPLIFVHLSGMIAVVGSAFTLLRLSRFNELTALLAAGVSLLRVAAPIVMVGIVLNVLLVADQELLIPQIVSKLIRSHDEMHADTPKNYPVQMMQDNHNGLFGASLYTPPSGAVPAHIDFLDVVERDAKLRPVGHLYADAATWNPQKKQWDLSDGWHATVLRPDETTFSTPTVTDSYKSDITPEEIALWRGTDYVALLPTARINELLAKGNNVYGQTNLLRTKHMRFTTPLANVVLLLLTVPAILSREPGKLKLAAMRCLTLCGLCMGSVFLSYQLAGTPPNVGWSAQWPALMAWMPIFLFGPLAVYLWEHIKT